ncbi:10774_t:CDS:2 [Ambispora leptoticha]|uniref:10774_t:CDS:1 n=1 Tax=Ambispora leptoticha TaxID=144679 RepID=A0A9N9AB63_9GLOM|nr:10774_t:CDS:2 [Ambispora leptoticha]
MTLKQQTQITTKNIEKNNKNNIHIKRKLRKSNTNEIDTTGKKSIFQVRGTSYPPVRRTLNNLKNSTNCKFCNQNYQYIDNIEARLRELDSIADKLCKIKVATKNHEIDKLDFSNMDIEDLLNISQSIQLSI